MPPAELSRATTPSRLLDLLRTAGTLSRVELAELSGLAPATITNVVRVLMEGGLVREVGREYQSRGQPRRLLQIHPEAWYAVGVHVEATRSTVVVVDFSWRRVSGSCLIGTGYLEPESAITSLHEHVVALLDSAGLDLTRVLGVCLVLHSPFDRETGALLTRAPRSPSRSFALRDAFASHLGRPVLLQDAADAAALDAAWTASVPTQTFAVLYMDSGIDGSIVVDGAAFSGRSGNAVRIGHIDVGVEAEVPCVCGRPGCLEAVAGPTAVIARALRDDDLVARTGITGLQHDVLLDFERLADSARDDHVARAILLDSAHHISRAAVLLVDLFDVETVVLAGPAFAAASDIYLPHARAALARASLSHSDEAPRILVSPLADSAATGGARTVLRTLPT